MRRVRVLPLLLAISAACALVSGASGADPRTPAALPGRPAPFLGIAVLGDGGLLAAVDAYGDVADLRAPGPAGPAQIDNPFRRQAAGSVPADTGIVPAAAAGGRAPRPLWRAAALRQRYLPQSNLLLTRARVAGARLRILDAASGERLARRIVVRGRPGQPLRLRLRVDLEPGTELRCRAGPGRVAGPAGADRVLDWRGHGVLHASLSCAYGAAPSTSARVTEDAATTGQAWLRGARRLGPRAPGWARRMYARSLLVLEALGDRRTGAVAAGARDRWAYVWPRDAGSAAIALARAGERGPARRAAGFLRGLDLGAGARFRGDGTPVADGRALPGDAAGWVRAAAQATGLRSAPLAAGAWRDRGDYGERDGDRGDYLANAIAGGAGAAEIRHLFAASGGLARRGDDPGSGLDSAAAWAVRPFPRPALFGEVRRTLIGLRASAGRYGLSPSQDWPGDQAWTAPAAWSAWSLAALGDRGPALAYMAMLRRAATPLGTIPERVRPADGIARSATPLGWTHSLALLALLRLYPDRGPRR